MLIRLLDAFGDYLCTQLPKATVSRHVHARRSLSTRLKGLITSFPLVLKRRAGAATLTREGRDRVQTASREVYTCIPQRLRG